MAGNNGIISTSTNVTCGNGTDAHGLLQIKAPADKGVRVRRFGVSFTGTNSAAARAKFDLMRTTSGGTHGAGSAVTPQKVSGHSGALTATGYENAGGGTEPSGGAVVRPANMAPTGPFEAPLDVVLAPGESLTIRTIAASMTGSAFFEYEE